MTELAALNVKITGDSTDLKAAVNTATGDLARLGAAARTTSGQVATLGPRMAQAASGGGGFAQSMRGVSQQLSQVGQQTMATGNFVQALAIQLPDLGLAFGAVGAAAGLLAGIALPMLISAFVTTGAQTEEQILKAERLKAAYEGVTEATYNLQTTIDKLRFGVDEEYQVELLQEQVRLRAEHTQKVIELNSYLATTTDSIDLQRIKTAGLVDEIAAVASAYDRNARLLAQQQDRAATLAVMEGVRVQRANEIAAKQEQAAEATRDAERAMQAAAGAAANAHAITQGLLGTTQSLAAAAWDYAGALGAQAKLAAQTAIGGGRGAGPGGPLAGTAEQELAGAGQYISYGSGGGGGGGGGGAGRDFAGELEAFQETLMTETELEAAQFAERQTLLQEFLSAKVVSLQEYQAYEQEIKAAHEAKMAEIEATAQQQRLSQTAGMFGALASIAQAGGQRMAKAAAAFQAIEGTVNAYGAAIKALNTPGLTPAGRFAAYASVLAAGLKGVASIRQAGGIGGGSGGASGGVAQAAGPSQAPLDVRLTGISANDLFSGAQLGSLLDRLSATAGDRGYRLMVAA